MRARLGDFAPSGSQLARDAGLRAALSFALARSFWNVMPLPRAGFRREPVAEPGRNESCPCGSLLKYKQCCQRVPALGEFDAAMLWPLVIENLDEESRRQALASRQLPREALLECASRALDAGNARQAIAWLEPQFAEPPRALDDLAGALLNLLCDALEQQRGGKRRKIALLERMAGLPQRSPLRSEAWQRLACIRMDAGQRDRAWDAFRHAQRDDPDNQALGMLEVQLLMNEDRNGEARDRARFHAAALRRRGGDVDPRIVEFYDALSRDPAMAMADAILASDRAPGGRLAALLPGLDTRALPDYGIAAESAAAARPLHESLAEQLRHMGVAASEIAGAVDELERELSQGSAEGTSQPGPAPSPAEAGAAGRESHVLVTPRDIAAAERAWHRIFPLDKPFSVSPVPADENGVWDSATEAKWAGHLQAHPEAFDSLDVLDDLVTAVMLHPDLSQDVIMQRLAEPLLRRAVAIIQGALAANPDAQIAWYVTGNRPALRSLFRLMEAEDARGSGAQSRLLAERMLRLNPGDNHGLRYRLAMSYLESGDNDACASLAAAYPDDIGPELRFNEALALYRLGKAKSAGDALRRAGEMSPRVLRYLLPGRIRKPKMGSMGVSFDGDDRAWLYRQSMRRVWTETPGALDWAKKVLAGS